MRKAELSNEAYHLNPAISKSHLDQVNRSPAHYWMRYLDPARQPTPPTEAMLIGTATHTAILEPHLWSEQVAVAPDGINRRTKEGKEAWAAFEADSTGKVVLKPEDAAVVRRMAEAVHQHPASSFLLDLPGVCEASYFWTDTETGLECKVRPDWHSEDRRLLVDVKTTDDASPEAFKRSCAKFRYHVQAAWYLRGLQAEQFLFIAVEKQPPHLVGVYVATPEMVAAGGRAADRNLTTIAECRAADRWPGYGDEIQPLDLPRFCDD
jgi:hypothetical protein